MEPAALLPGGREHLARRAPEPQRAVPDGEHRGPHPGSGAVTQQVGPGRSRAANARCLAVQGSVNNIPVIFGVFRAHGGRIAEVNRARWPGSGSTRRSFTCGAVTSTASALVRTAALRSASAGHPCKRSHRSRTTSHPRVSHGLFLSSSELGDYGEHGLYLPDRRWRVGLACGPSR